jgi:hypothetical protein
MPTINLRDARNRNAQVSAESIGSRTVVRQLGSDGAPAKMRKVLRGTIEHSLEQLLAQAGDIGKLSEVLAASDPEVDIERMGMFLNDPARVYVNERNEIVYQINQIEVVHTSTGEEKERRPRRRAEPNVDIEIPINWTGRMLKKVDALQRFVFASKLQIMHINGLTYDFLYAMAKELADANSLMLLTAGKNGKEPLIFRHGATPYRGFLEGRIDGDKYVLLLHLSNQELKRPAPAPAVEATPEAPKPAAEAKEAKPLETPAEKPKKATKATKVKPDTANIVAQQAPTDAPAKPKRTRAATRPKQ